MNYQELLDQSITELQMKTAAHDQLWHLGESAWTVDQTEGKIVFTRDGEINAVCDVQIIGTYSTDDRSWLWGWDHPSVLPDLSRHAQTLLEFGEQHGVDTLTTRKLTDLSEDDCWAFAALACKLNDAQGAYRGPAGPALVFMTFGSPTLSST